AAARGLGSLQLGPLPHAERQMVAERCLAALEAASGDGEWVVRYAVAVGLEALAPALAEEAAPLQQLCQALRGLSDDPAEEAPVVQLRARLALRRLEP
ncbi:MAG: HEAT repeat domain-containing protein, partial [Vulcanococcus sp.]